ncbi:MAG: S8 family serine peptidase [Halolamina sp.]
MPRQFTRRSALAGIATTLGGLAAGPQVVAAERDGDRYLVDTRSLSASELSAHRVVHDLGAIDAAVVETDAPEGIDARHAPDVSLTLDLPVSARRLTAPASTVDALSDLQWDKRYQRVETAHDHARGEGTRVAVIDTGVTPSHPDLRHAVNEELSRNLTDDGGDFTDVGLHGTHVSGIVAAGNRSGRGVVGTAPATELVACRVFPEFGGASFGTVLAGMVYAADVEADVANMSLGAYPLPLADSEVQLLLDLLQRAAAYGNRQGTVFVAAAGNDGANLDADGLVISLPNEADNVLSVGATGPIGFRWDDDAGDDDPMDDLRAAPTDPAPYTNYGEEAIDLSAGGGNLDRSAADSDARWFYDLVFSTLPDGYGWLAGTSMAAPQVAAAAALVGDRYPDADAAAVGRHLRETAEGASAQAYHGAGHLDTVAAVTEEP